MKLIQVKYLSADNTQGARFSASVGWDGPLRRITKGYDYALDYDDNVLAAARQLVAKIWETNAPEIVPDVGSTRAGFDVVRLKFQTKKTYLCKEGNDEFVIEAENIQEAKELVQIYNGIVIKEILEKEAQ
tara:strand:+ start:1107 stop:1496 length:390 start_codon:yes stop_codon:yes gene_type:complete